MKKRSVSLFVLFAMLFSLAAMSAISVSAVSTHDGRIGVYATTKPEIDGVRDSIYTTAPGIEIKNGDKVQGSYQILWDETGIYLFFEITNGSKAESIGVYISGIAYTMEDANSAKWWENYRGDYQFKYRKSTADGTWGCVYANSVIATSKAPQVPEGFAYAHQETDAGINAEFYIPMKSTDWNLNLDKSSFIGLGVILSNWLAASGCQAGQWPSEYGLSAVRLDPNPCTHNSTVYTQTVAPTFTKAGEECGVCPVCGKELSREVPPITIQYLGVQNSSIAENATYNARFVAQIAELEAFQSAGFEVTMTYGKTLDSMSVPVTKELKTTRAYSSILAGEEKVTPTGEGKYLVALPVTDIPVNEDVVYVTFVIRPFTVSEDGEVTFAADSYTVTFHSGGLMK